MSPTEDPAQEPEAGRPRTSPRLTPPASSEPEPTDTSLTARCPICPNPKGELHSHLRKVHPDFPFLPSDFPPGSVDVCHLCGAVVKPGDKALAYHRSSFCKGQTEEMRARLAGGTVRDKKGRTLSSLAGASPSSSPLRRTSSAPHTSSPLRNATLTADAPVTPSRQRPLRPSSSLPTPGTPSAPQSQPTDSLTDDFYTEASSLADLLPLPGINKHLHPKLVRSFTECAARLAEKHRHSPSRRSLFHILALVKVGLVPAIQQGHDAVHARLAAYPNVSFPCPPEERSGYGSRIRRAKALIEAGLISKADRALCDETGVAGLTAETIKALQDKHPQGEANPFSAPIHASVPYPELPEASDILNGIRTMDNGTSPGPSGWSVRLVSQAATAPTFLAFLTGLTGEMGAGTALGPDLLCAARLTPLLKPLPPDAPPTATPGIRPIAVGEVFYRLAMRSLFAANFKSDFLSPNQFGVGTRGGVEPIIRAVKLAANHHHDFQYTHLISLDSVNAFNDLLRSYLAASLQTHAPSLTRLAAWCYNTTTPLYVHSGGSTATIQSAKGVRQGDPMGPLLFSIGIRPLVEELQDILGPRCLVLAYLDDIFILTSDPADLYKAMDLFNSDTTPISLNASKCRIYELAKAFSSHPIDLLGTRIGSPEARTTFLRDKVAEVEQGLDMLKHLPKQHALLLLRRSAQNKLRHLLRTLHDEDLAESWEQLDRVIWTAFDDVRGPLLPADTTRDRTIISLPPSLGGIGLLSHQTIAPLALKAANALADKVLSHFAPSLMSDSPAPTQRELCREVFSQQQQDLMADLQTHERVVLAEAACMMGRRWLETTPSSPKFELSDQVVQANLAYRSLMPGHEGPCSRCATANSTGHDEWCPGRSDFKVARHESVKHRLAAGLRSSALVSVTVEPYIFGGPHRRNDIRVDNTGDSHPDFAAEEYDVKVVVLTAPSHLRELHASRRPDPSHMTETRTRIQGVLAYAAKRKVRALPPATTGQSTDTPFLPLIFSSGGILEAETKKKLGEWKKWGVSRSAFEWMITSIAVGLARARGRTFQTK